MYSVVTAKGQVTIPAQIREELGIKPGMLVAFEVKKGRKNKKKQVKTSITITPATKKPNLVEELHGCLSRNRKIKYVPLDKVRQQIADTLGKKYKKHDK